jgi:hypothetical protein
MKLSRRDFARLSLGAGAALWLPEGSTASAFYSEPVFDIVVYGQYC